MVQIVLKDFFLKVIKFYILKSTSNNILIKILSAIKDIKLFSGRIVYNPDGSAYILEEEDLLNQLPRQAGAILDNEDLENNQVGFLWKRVHFRVTTPFTRKTLLAEAHYSYYHWFTTCIELSTGVIFEL